MNEQQQEEQSFNKHAEFMDWFNGNEIRGDFFKACAQLSDKIPQVIDLNTLELAFHYKEQPGSDTSHDDDWLPF